MLDFCLLMTPKLKNTCTCFTCVTLHHLNRSEANSSPWGQTLSYIRQHGICTSALFLQLSADLNQYAHIYTDWNVPAHSSPLTFVASPAQHAQTYVSRYRGRCFCYCFCLACLVFVCPKILLLPRLVVRNLSCWCTTYVHTNLPLCCVLFPHCFLLVTDRMSAAAVQEAEKYRMYTLAWFGNCEEGQFVADLSTCADSSFLMELESFTVRPYVWAGPEPVQWVKKDCQSPTANSVRLNPQAKCSYWAQKEEKMPMFNIRATRRQNALSHSLPLDTKCSFDVPSVVTERAPSKLRKTPANWKNTRKCQQRLNICLNVTATCLKCTTNYQH